MVFVIVDDGVIVIDLVLDKLGDLLDEGVADGLFVVEGEGLFDTVCKTEGVCVGDRETLGVCVGDRETLGVCVGVRVEDVETL